MSIKTWQKVQISIIYAFYEILNCKQEYKIVQIYYTVVYKVNSKK